jgi:chromosomal replication initiator protein
MPADQQLESTWAAFLERLRSEIPDDVYRIWLQPLRAVGRADETLYVQAPKQTRDWIKRRFGEALSRLLGSIDSSLSRVELVTDAGPIGRGGAAIDARGCRLNPSYRFEEFVIGAGNRFGHAAALAAAELPAQAYNPLFLHGPPGVGKTHLLHAIGNYTTFNDRALDVVYVTGEAFTGDFTSAIRAGRMEVFKQHYRQADLLLLDDVQFVESKPRTGEELLHTFDALMSAGAQVVIAADRAPSVMPALDSRLRDRFESGLLINLDPPDFETRLSIVHKRAGAWLSGHDQLPALELLARRVSSSIHALEGALIRVRAYSSLTQQPLTPALVEHVLGHLYAAGPSGQRAAGKPSIDRIQEITCGALSLDLADLSSAKRGRQVVYARQVAMYLCRELTDLSLPAIGQRFGGRDHTTVLHAHRQMRSRLLTDDSTRQLVENLMEQLEVGAQRT